MINETDTIEKRKVIGALKTRLEHHKSVLSDLKKYRGTQLSIVEILNLAGEYLNGLDGSEARQTHSSLMQFVHSAEERLERVSLEIEEIRQRIASVNDEFPKEQEYLLHAILVHSGSPDLGGHYWAYIRDHQSDTWWKFNDVSVSVVDSFDEIASQSFGDNIGATSAYALVYLKAGEVEAWNEVTGVPRWAERIVREDNEQFRAELNQWRRLHPEERTNEQKLEELQARLQQLDGVGGSMQFTQACSLSWYGKLREFPPRMLQVLLADELQAVLPQPVTEEEQQELDLCKRDFQSFSRAVILVNHGLMEYFDDPTSLKAIAVCAGYFAVALKETTSQVLTGDFSRLLYAGLSSLIPKALFAFQARLKDGNYRPLIDFGPYIWAACLECGRDKKYELTRSLKDILQNARQPEVGVFRKMVLEERAPQLDVKRDTTETMDAVCQSFAVVCDQFHRTLNFSS